MKLIAKATLTRYASLYPDAKRPLKIWMDTVNHSEWKTPNDVKRDFSTASFVGNNRVVFNVKGNTYRLVVGISYKAGIVFVKFFGTHAQYDRIDVSSVEEH